MFTCKCSKNIFIKLKETYERQKHTKESKLLIKKINNFGRKNNNKLIQFM